MSLDEASLSPRDPISPNANASIHATAAQAHGKTDLFAIE